MQKSYIFLVALFTINGAIAQWVPQNSGVKKDLWSVYFTDTNTGYAVGDSGTILKTSNAGTNWIALSSGTTLNLYSVQFTNANTGYIAGETILKTSNTGTSWSDISGGTNFGVSICFPSANIGYAVGGGLNAIKTINGGSIWTNISLIGNGQLNSVYFTDSNTGYIVSDYAQHGGISKTIDGGTTWNFIGLAGLNPIAPLFSIYFPDANTGYAVGGYWIGNSSTIYKTTNGGSDWSLQNLANLPTLRSVYFTDANTGYAVGDSGTILKTSNGGTDWKIQNSGTSHNLISVFFTDANMGYAVGDSGTILKTTNGGGLGVNDQPSSLNYLKIYPNPIKDKITIELLITGNTQFSIINVSGQELMMGQITDNKTKIDASNLPKGVYFVKLTNKQTLEVRKIIKE
jgi:photosystem II stability/assembly factor-like uncharacterized protein